MLRFVSVRRQSAYTADGPRAGAVRLRRFWGTGDGALGGADVGLGNVGNAKFGGCAVLVCLAVRALRSLELGRSKLGTWGLKEDLGVGAC